MSKGVWDYSKWKSHIYHDRFTIGQHRCVAKEALRVAEKTLAHYETQIAIVEKQDNVEKFAYMSEIKDKIDDLCWEALWTQKEWNGHLRVEQLEINCQKQCKNGLAYCELVLERCDTLYKEQNAKVESQLENLRQKYGELNNDY